MTLLSTLSLARNDFIFLTLTRYKTFDRFHSLVSQNIIFPSPSLDLFELKSYYSSLACYPLLFFHMHVLLTCLLLLVSIHFSSLYVALSTDVPPLYSSYCCSSIHLALSQSSSRLQLFTVARYLRLFRIYFAFSFVIAANSPASNLKDIDRRGDCHFYSPPIFRLFFYPCKTLFRIHV